MSQPTILVTGASGNLGRAVLRHLSSAGATSIVATTRNPDALVDFAAQGVEVRRADYDDPASLRTAFEGVDRAVLISTDALAVPGHRADQHRAAVAALKEAGVQHVVYTSVPAADRSPELIAADHAATEVALKESGLTHTLLRNNLYADLLLAFLPGSVARGVHFDARAEGAVAWVTRDDCARAIAAALTGEVPSESQVFDVTGPAAVGSQELVALVAEVTGRPLVLQQGPVSAVHEALSGMGLPEHAAAVLASIDAGVARGDFANPSTTVADLTGQEPTPLRAFLEAHRDALLTAP